MRKSWKTVERMMHREYCKKQCGDNKALFHQMIRNTNRKESKRKIRYKQRKILKKTMDYEAFIERLEYCKQHEVWNNHIWDCPFVPKKVA